MPTEDPFGNGEILPVLETKFRFFPPVQSMLPFTSSTCCSALGSAIYGIQWAHNLAGIPSPPDSPTIKAVSNATKQLTGTSLFNKKEPVSPDMLEKLVEASTLDNLLELRNVCIFLLTFAVFSELMKFSILGMETLFFIQLMSLLMLIEVRPINLGKVMK